MQQTAEAFYVAADTSTLLHFPVTWITDAAGFRCILYAGDASTLHPFPVIWITAAAGFRCILFVADASTLIPSPRSGSKLQQTAAFYVAADVSRLNLFPSESQMQQPSILGLDQCCFYFHKQDHCSLLLI
jgi:hypothetical protein